MVNQKTLEDYLNNLLSIDRFTDACPNGLQVEGKTHISRIVTGVTASQALIERAIDHDADAIIVHHGYFWKGENPALVGFKQRRIKALLAHDINLYAFHLPLDAHPIFGNNALLCQALNATPVGSFGFQDIGLLGQLPQTTLLTQLKSDLETLLNRSIFVAGNAEKAVSMIGLCSGGGQSYFNDAINAGAECFLSGEISEHLVHEAIECGVPYLMAGHHATERFGIQALGEHLATQFEVDVRFMDIDSQC